MTDPTSPSSGINIRALHAQPPSWMTLSQRILRKWASDLDPYELTLVLRIADMTIGWQETQKVIPTDRLLNGDRMYGPLNMSRSKMFLVLNSLEKKGAIKRANRGYTSDGRTAVKLYSVNLGWQSPSERTKNTQGEQSTSWTSRSTVKTNLVRQVDPIETNENKNIEKETVVSASPRPVPAAIDLVRAQIASASAASHAARSAKAQTLPDRIAGIEAAWRAALEEAFPQCGFGAWSVREKAQVKAKLKTWIVKDGPMVEFIDWSVRNWSAIISKQFRWMTRSPAPKVPEIGFLLSFMAQFLECRAEGKLDEWLASPERSEFEKLTTRGLSEQEAAAEIGKRRAVEGMREENERVRIEARARVRTAQIIEKRTEVMANLPPHPDSEVARRARGEIASGPLISAKEVELDLDNQPNFDPNWEPPD